ncbi:MAG: permease-like cell division protein FtsX [Candidatus Zixiibacteriota bacterium]
MKHLGFYIKEALKNIGRGGILTAAAVLAITFAGLIAGIFATGYFNLRAIYEDVKSELYVDVYLRDEVEEGRAAAIGDHLSKLPGVVRADFVSREEAAEEFVGLFPEDQALLDVLSDNPLPASYRVYLTAEAGKPAEVEKLVAEIAAIDGVEDAVYGQEWLENLERAASVVGMAGGVVGGVLGAAAILVVISTIGLAVYARRETIGIMKVVGATDGFVRAPFVVEGFIIGAVGGLIALGALYGGVAFLRSYDVAVEFIPPTYVAAGLGLSALAGAFGSSVAVRRFLKV